MKYFSTRNNCLKVTASQAIARGLAPDGGLFVPEVMPALTQSELSSLCNLHYRGRALYIMAKFLYEFEKEELESFVNAAHGKTFTTRTWRPSLLGKAPPCWSLAWPHLRV